MLFCCRYFFSKDGGPTVLPKQGGEQMGQRTHLSHLDIERLNRLYHCGITSLLYYCSIIYRFHVTLLQH